MRPLLLGIDPGQSGGIAELWPDGKIDAFPMFADDALRDYFQCIAENKDVVPVCYMELVQGFIGKAQPGSSMFKFGNGYGFLRGLLSANRIRTVLVRPQEWQKGIPGAQGLKGPERKRALRDQAARLFPNSRVTLATADALLIANFGQNQSAISSHNN